METNNIIGINVLRAIGLLIAQVLVFKRISLGFETVNYVDILVYPIFFMLLPVKTPHALAVLIGFFYGLALDSFYGVMGLHAGTCVFIAFVRPFVLALLEPKGGYNMNIGPTKIQLGLPWTLQYTSILLAAHLFYYFSMEAFTFYYIFDILLHTIISFIFSFVFVLMYQFLLDPKA